MTPLREVARSALSDMIVVTRHPGAARWVADELGLWPVMRDGQVIGLALPDAGDGPIESEYAPVMREVTPAMVRDSIVVGNLPLDLAAEAREVWAIVFRGQPPRGEEYTERDMRAAGARLWRFRVERITS